MSGVPNRYYKIRTGLYCRISKSGNDTYFVKKQLDGKQYNATFSTLELAETHLSILEKKHDFKPAGKKPNGQRRPNVGVPGWGSL